MKKPITKIYTPESSICNPADMVREMARDLLSSRELSLQLVIRDIKSQYRQTALGLLWAFILPVANAAAWLFIQSAGIVTIKTTTLPYPVYVFSGTILWSIFMDAVHAPLSQTNAAKSMLAKINFPREALILSGIYQTLFNAGIKIAILFIVILLFGVMPDWHIVFFPFTLLSLVLAGTALGLVITPVGMLYTDVGKSLPLLMQFLMYLTPVVFPMPSNGLALILFQTNPLTPLITTTRCFLTGSVPDSLGTFFVVNFLLLTLLVLMWVVYRAAMPILIERMSA